MALVSPPRSHFLVVGHVEGVQLEDVLLEGVLLEGVRALALLVGHIFFLALYFTPPALTF